MESTSVGACVSSTGDVTGSFDDKVALVTKLLLQMDDIVEFKRAIKRELVKNEYALEQLQASRRQFTLQNVMEKLGISIAIKRHIMDLYSGIVANASQAAQERTKEEEALLIPQANSNSIASSCSLDVISHAKQRWEQITRDEILRFANESGQPLVQECLQQQEEAAPTESAAKPPKPAGRFLYDGKDLLHALQEIRPANRNPEHHKDALWGMLQLQLYSPPMHELRRIFSELSPVNGQIGLDELFPQEREAFLQEKNRIGDAVAAHESISMARQYAKTGCPISLRPQIWREALNIRIGPEEQNEFADLQTKGKTWKYLTDEMYQLDLQQAIDSCDYFVFEDHLTSVIMAFARDVHVQHHALRINGTVELPPSASATSSSSTPSSTSSSSIQAAPSSLVPPNGVLPFSGLVMYLAPLNYMYADPIDTYFVFRAMYERYWCKLNAISSDKGTILPLCKLFEDSILQTSSSTVFHLLNVGLKPVEIAFPWIQSAFSGYLEIPQVLLLWDRVVGYDSLDIIALAAAALFHFRSPQLEAIRTNDELEELFAELIEIQIIPLLQEYIFLVGNNAANLPVASSV